MKIRERRNEGKIKKNRKLKEFRTKEANVKQRKGKEANTD